MWYLAFPYTLKQKDIADNGLCFCFFSVNIIVQHSKIKSHSLQAPKFYIGWESIKKKKYKTE